MALHLPPLQEIVTDPIFAWELLNTQVAVELSTVASSDHIAKLLTLYMLGVQKCNSVLDPRQIYFKTKVNMLMSRQNVIKGLTAEHSQIKPNKNKETVSKETNGKKHKKSKKVQKIQTPTKHSEYISMINPILFQKRKELQMRLAFEGADQNSPETLQKVIKEFESKQAKMSSQIKEIYKYQETSLEERLRKRKQKTMTVTSISKLEDNNMSIQQLPEIKQFLIENLQEEIKIYQKMRKECFNKSLK